MTEPAEKPPFKRFPLEPGKTYGLMCLVPGESPQTGGDPQDEVQAWPAALIRELLLFVLVLTVLCLLAYFFDAPLEEPANALHPPNPAKAPWYFLGLQELVSYDAFWGGVGIPGLLVVLAMAAPYMERRPGGEGIWFHPDRSAPNWIFLTVMITLGVLTVIGALFRGANWQFVVPW